MSDATNRVLRGIDYLNRKITGWIDRIDLDSLSMSSDCECVIGQIAGSWCVYTEQKDLTDKQSEEYGFCIPDDVIDRPSAWAELDYRWTIEIQRLRIMNLEHKESSNV